MGSVKPAAAVRRGRCGLTPYIADTLNHAVRKTPDGLISTLAGTTIRGQRRRGPANKARLSLPSAVAVMPTATSTWQQTT